MSYRLTDIDSETSSLLAASSGKGSNKQLIMFVKLPDKRVWFVIREHKVDVFKGPSLTEAISIYNNLQ